MWSLANNPYKIDDVPHVHVQHVQIFQIISISTNVSYTTLQDVDIFCEKNMMQLVLTQIITCLIPSFVFFMNNIA